MYMDCDASDYNEVVNDDQSGSGSGSGDGGECARKLLWAAVSANTQLFLSSCCALSYHKSYHKSLTLLLPPSYSH